MSSCYDEIERPVGHATLTKCQTWLDPSCPSQCQTCAWYWRRCLVPDQWHSSFGPSKLASAFVLAVVSLVLFPFFRAFVVCVRYLLGFFLYLLPKLRPMTRIKCFGRKSLTKTERNKTTWSTIVWSSYLLIHCTCSSTNRSWYFVALYIHVLHAPHNIQRSRDRLVLICRKYLIMIVVE